MKILLIIFLLFCVPACTGIPVIKPADDAEKNMLINKSQAPFLKGRWRLVHSINGTLPGGATVSMIGISIASPESAGLHCTLMSIEGLVVLDADYDGGLAINRGIGPFKSEDIAMGIIRDVRLILFQPGGRVTETGSMIDGNKVCRYRSDDGVTDVVMKVDGTAEIHSFDKSLKLTRIVVFGKLRQDGIPVKIELTGYGLFQYGLELDLIEAELIR
jgi:hypothetical protein